MRRGFTLIELLVTMLIIAMVVGISFPFLRGMARTSNVQMAANSIITAVAGARSYATIPTPAGFFVPSSGDGGPVRTAHDDGNGYSGTAVIVTPSNELRFVENDPEAKDANGRMLELHPSTHNRNGYHHISRGNNEVGIDDIRLPSDVALLGIVRNSLGEVVLLPAPFAISFNQRGTITIGAHDPDRLERFLYYDADGDGTYDLTSVRDSSNNLTEFHRGSAVNSDGRTLLPWERIEPVIGVVIIDPREVEVYDPDRTEAFTAEDSNAIVDRAASTGRILFFNRQTGRNVAR